jgi:hypothetical protein
MTNQSAYNLNQVFFNASDDITGLALTAVSGGGGLPFWGLEQRSVGTGGGQPTHVGGFGTFDYALLDGRGTNRGILPGGSAVFTLSISGAGPFEIADFVQGSSVEGGQRSAFAAAHFAAGPGDDSSFGAVIPEGDSFRLFGLGLLLVASAPALGLTRQRRPFRDR